jgi:hypothetical protein
LSVSYNSWLSFPKFQENSFVKFTLKGNGIFGHTGANYIVDRWLTIACKICVGLFWSHWCKLDSVYFFDKWKKTEFKMSLSLFLHRSSSVMRRFLPTFRHFNTGAKCCLLRNDTKFLSSNQMWLKSSKNFHTSSPKLVNPLLLVSTLSTITVFHTSHTANSTVNIRPVRYGLAICVLKSNAPEIKCH